MDPPTIGEVIDFDAVTALIQADTRTNLDFDVEILGAGMGVDGEPATAVSGETGSANLVHITVLDVDRDSGEVGAAPRIW